MSNFLKRPQPSRKPVLKMSPEEVLVEIHKLTHDEWENLIADYFWACGADQVEMRSRNAQFQKESARIVAKFENLKCVIYVHFKRHENVAGAYTRQQIYDFADSVNEDDVGYTQSLWVISTHWGFTGDCSTRDAFLIEGLEFANMLLAQKKKMVSK